MSAEERKKAKNIQKYFLEEREKAEKQKHRSKMLKIKAKEKSTRSSPRKMTLHIQGNPTKLTSDFLYKNTRRQWDQNIQN